MFDFFKNKDCDQETKDMIDSYIDTIWQQVMNGNNLMELRSGKFNNLANQLHNKYSKYDYLVFEYISSNKKDIRIGVIGDFFGFYYDELIVIDKYDNMYNKVKNIIDYDETYHFQNSFLPHNFTIGVSS